MSKNVVLLLLGETGAGKSTFLNYSASYFLKGYLSADTKYSKLRTVVPNMILTKATDGTVRHAESNIHDRTKSQTNKANIYNFKDADGVNYALIDTPGFGDTDRSKDERNLQNIMSTASEQPFISAVVLLINGTTARETTNLKYVIDSMKGAVPNSLLNNLIIVLTNCDETTSNFSMKLLDCFNTKKVFYMQNNCFSQNHENSPPKTWRKLENEWNESMETLQEIFEHCKSLTEGSARDFAQMRIKRENLMRTANEIIAEQTKLIQAIESITLYQKLVQDAKSVEEANQNFKQLKKIKVKEMKKTEYYNTACSTHLNEMVCHENCGLDVKTSTNESHFLNCAAAGGKNCRVCECPMSIHYHIFEIPVDVWKDQETIIQEMKLKYDSAKENFASSKNDLDTTETLKKNLEKAIDDKKTLMIKTCRELKAICSNFNFFEELKGIIENIEKEAAMCRNFDDKKSFETLAKAIRNMIQ